MTRHLGRRNLVALAGACLGVAAMSRPVAAAKAGPAIGAVHLSGSGISVVPVVRYEVLVVTVTGPGSIAVRKEFTAGQGVSIAVGEGDRAWPDGQYRYELRAVPRVDPGVREALRAAREAEGQPSETLAAPVGSEPVVQSGAFRVQSGSILVAASGVEASPVGQMLLVPENLYVQGSACVGTDCVDAEAMGFDTIRLKENNLRLAFDDTSTSAGFPANDWRLTANDTASGGANKFSIDDITGAKTPFTVEAGALTNSLYIDGTGRIGLRTATPLLDVHLHTGNTPALRLEQDNSVGFTAQTWDVAGNEANFFVRDVTGGSLLPFRIRPGAPTSSLDIAASGNVGVGTQFPAASLEVSRSDGSTLVLIENSEGPVRIRRLLDMQNNGGVRMRMLDTDTGTTWGHQNIASQYIIDADGGVNEFLLTTAGNLTISGTLSQNSDRNLKTAVMPVDGEEVLDTLAKVPITTWVYKAEAQPGRHMGAMAQDFAAAFGLGKDDTRLAPADVAGVALAAIQALHGKVRQLDAELAALRAHNAAQGNRLAALEAALGNVRLQEVHQVLDGDRLVEHGDPHP